MRSDRAPRHALTVFAVRSHIGGEPVTTFDQVIDPDLLHSPTVTAYDVPAANDFEVRFYVQEGESTPPPWARFLESAEGMKAIQWPYRKNVSGLLIVRLKLHDGGYFALAFGPTARRLLRDDAYDRRFGLRTALNILCEGPDRSQDAEGVQLQQTTSSRVGAVIRHHRQQTSRPVSFYTFGLDPQQDLLSGVVGRPVRHEFWGRRVEGSESITVRQPFTFAQVGRLCRSLASMAAREDYKRWFGWIDDVEEVTGARRKRLVELLAAQLRTDPGELVLTAPEILEWERVDHFRIVAGRNRTDIGELVLRDYLAFLDRSGLRAGLDAAALDRHQVEAVDSDGVVIYNWSVLRGLDGEIGGGSGQNQPAWFASAGRFYEVAGTFLEKLNHDLRLIRKTSLSLPAYQHGQAENAYARTVASPDVLVLDRELVRIAGRGSVEICDLVTTDRRLVYLKRMRESSFSSELLSHLFTQATVAAELLRDGEEYLGRIAAKARETEEKWAQETDDQDCVGRFSAEFSKPFVPHGREIILGIIGPWRGHDLIQKLPFFSKVSLRKAASRIRSLGYEVTYAPIESFTKTSRR